MNFILQKLNDFMFYLYHCKGHNHFPWQTCGWCKEWKKGKIDLDKFEPYLEGIE